MISSGCWFWTPRPPKKLERHRDRSAIHPQLSHASYELSVRYCHGKQQQLFDVRSFFVISYIYLFILSRQNHTLSYIITLHQGLIGVYIFFSRHTRYHHCSCPQARLQEALYLEVRVWIFAEMEMDWKVLGTIPIDYRIFVFIFM